MFMRLGFMALGLLGLRVHGFRAGPPFELAPPPGTPPLQPPRARVFRFCAQNRAPLFSC